MSGALPAVPRVAVLLATALLSGFVRGQVPPAPPPVSLGLELPASAFVGERIPVRFVVDVDRAFRDRQLVQLFRTPLDLPVQIEAPWLERPPAGTAWALPPKADRDEVGGGPRLAFADRIVRARPLDGGAPGRERFAVDAALIVDAPGDRTFEGATVRYAFGTEFREDFLNGRVALDRSDERVAAAAAAIAIRPLPAPAPAGFTGAVGTFEIAARATVEPEAESESEAEAEALAVGETFVLELAIGGSGNFGHFGPPDLGGQAGLHVLSLAERANADAMTATYRLRADRPSAALPALTWVAFDPAAGAYVTLRTAPLGFAVRGADGSTAAPGGGNESAWVRSWSGGSEAARLDPLALGLATVAPWALAGGLWVWRRRRQAIAADPLGHRARTAFARLREALGRPDAAPADAFAEYLAAQLRCPTSAVIGGPVAQRLVAQGIAPSLAERAQTLLEELSHTRYAGGAGGPTADDAARVLDLARELDARPAGDTA